MAQQNSIWIIGPACAGKKTLSRLFIKKARDQGLFCVLLDSPTIREVFGSKLGYDSKSRQKQTIKMMRLAKLISSQNILTVVSAIHPFEIDRNICREKIPGYFEVYLKCDLTELIERDNRKLYLPALRGQKKNVIGVDIQFEEPRTADLIIESDKTTPDKMLEILWQRFLALSKST